jgi:hypothetical protein
LDLRANFSKNYVQSGQRLSPRGWAAPQPIILTRGQMMSLALLGEIAKTRQSASPAGPAVPKQAALKATRKNSKLRHEDTGDGSPDARFLFPASPRFRIARL